MILRILFQAHYGHGLDVPGLAQSGLQEERWQDTSGRASFRATAPPCAPWECSANSSAHRQFSGVMSVFGENMIDDHRHNGVTAPMCRC
jgi:hypothetical protein